MSVLSALGVGANLAAPDCGNVRSSGVVLLSAGQGVRIAGNVISNVQSGVFVNGPPPNGPLITGVRVEGNVISNVDILDGIYIQGSISGVYWANRITHMVIAGATKGVPVTCGIADHSNTNSSGNFIAGNWINDSYCGVAYVSSDRVGENTYLNTIYETINADDYPNGFPLPLEPGQ